VVNEQAERMIFTKKRVHGIKIEVFVLGEGWQDYKILKDQGLIHHSDLKDLPKHAPPIVERPLTSKNSSLNNLNKWY